MPSEPTVKRVAAFIDGQNLYHQAKDAFGYHYPNYDFPALAEAVCDPLGWELRRTYFYTGVPDQNQDRFWNAFWTRKLAVMGTRGIQVFSRHLRHGKEKGIDVRIALDSVQAARNNDCDVILIFSQDQDLSEAADEIRQISIDEDRWIKVASAYPFTPTVSNQRGINGTEWIKIERSTYDHCIDPRDYRPSRSILAP